MALFILFGLVALLSGRGARLANYTLWSNVEWIGMSLWLEVLELQEAVASSCLFSARMLSSILLCLLLLQSLAIVQH
jgi:hypothetical protein